MSRLRRYKTRFMTRVMPKISPTLYHAWRYRNAARQLKPKSQERDRLVAELIKSEGPCLQIGVKEMYGDKFGPNWTAVDLYDQRPFIDFHYDVQDLKFDDNSFDVVYCQSILEHVPRPQQAVRELLRVLRPGGKIWLQLPFCFYYHEDPEDYWRASPAGIRAWIGDACDEIDCGVKLIDGSYLVVSAFYYGTKRELHEESSQT